MPNGVTRQTTFDLHRDLLASIIHTNKTGNLLTRRTFSYDAIDRLTARTQYRLGDAPPRSDAFSYNTRSELTQAMLGTNAYAYTFDPVGNRQTAAEPEFSAIYTANPLNQYTNISYGQTSVFVPSFDTDGNQTLLKTTTGIWYVRYNGENRPVCFSNGTAVISMDYDYMGRRFFYRETQSDAVIRHERYLYRDYLRIAALDMLNASTVIHTVVWDPSEPVATRPLLLSSSSGWHTYGFDQVKNIGELFDVDGIISSKYDYTPFGAIKEAYGGAVVLNPLTFSSEVGDSVLGLIYYNWRHLNTSDGRWFGYDHADEYGYDKHKQVGIFQSQDYVFINNQIMDNVDILGQTIRAEPNTNKTPPIKQDDIYKCSPEQMKALESAVADICSGIDSCPCEATTDAASKKAQKYIKSVCEKNKDSLIKDFVVGCAKDSVGDCKGAWGFYPPNSRRAIICEKSFGNRPGGVQCTLIHELGHVATAGHGGEKPATDMTKCLNCPPP